MRTRPRNSWLAVVLACAWPLCTLAQAGAGSDAQARVIVKFKGEPPVLAHQALGKRLALALQPGPEVGERLQVLKAGGMSSQQLAERLSQQPDVEYAVPDRRRRLMATPNDPLYAQGGSDGPVAGQWYLRPPNSVERSAIDAAAAWDVTQGRADMVVAVLDTGVRFEHPDLQRASTGGKLLDGYDFIADAGTANDGNARDADASDPGDWTAADECGSGEKAKSSSWHGTEVAGIVGALTHNATGMAGTGWNVKVLPVRVLGKCGGFDSDILAGMRWAAGIAVPGVPDNPSPARVINLSLGGSGACSAAYRDAVDEITARGTVIVASAGNSAGHAVAEPANCPGVIGVAGLRHTGTKVGFSSIGPELSIAAPGGNCVNTSGACLYPLLTTTNSGTQGPAASGYTDGSNISVGTSYSAPLASGVSALMASANTVLDVAQIRRVLRSTARAFPTSGAGGSVAACAAPTGSDQLECYCTTATCGAGMLDAGAAVQAAANGRAFINVSPAAPVAGQPVQLAPTDSFAAAGRSIAAYQWTLVDGGGIVGSVPAGSPVSVTPSGAGSFTVRLTVTDDAGGQLVAMQTIDVQAPASTPTPVPSGGGGGALGLGEVLAALAVVAAVAAFRPRRRKG
jgi:serine protease